MEQVFDTPGGVTLRIKLPSGRVVVTTADEPRTTVRLVSQGRRDPDAIEGVDVRAEQRADGKTVVVVEERDRIRWGPLRISWTRDVEARITCPRGADLDFAGATTDLRVEGELGEVSARTASGDIALDEVRDRLQVKTASGDVYVGTLLREGTIATVSGDLGVGAVRAPLAARTVSGPIVVRSVEDGELRVQTVSGDVRIGVGRGTRVWIDASSISGGLDSRLGLAEEPPDVAGSPESLAVVPLHVKTVSGDVSIVHALEGAAA